MSEELQRLDFPKSLAELDSVGTIPIAESLPHHHVVAAIFVRDVPDAIGIGHRQILACRRGYGKWEGWWEFPGGKVLPGEDAEAALHREIGEELEVSMEVLRRYGTIDYRYDDFDMTMDLYLCRLSDGPVALNAHSAVRWCAADDLAELRWLPADVRLVGRWTADGFDF